MDGMLGRRLRCSVQDICAGSKGEGQFTTASAQERGTEQVSSPKQHCKAGVAHAGRAHAGAPGQCQRSRSGV